MPLRVSVVIPAYNAARFLPDAIASLRTQTRPVDQIIVVDDGSRDDTAQAVAGLGEGVTYVYQENAGVSAARNRGIAEATGDIVAFLDADDRWLPDKVARQLAVFDSNPAVGLVAADRREVDAEDRVLVDSLFMKRGLSEEFVRLDGRPIANALSRLVRTNFLPTSSVMVSRRVLDEVGVFDATIRYGEDLELWARIAARHPVVCLPDVLVLYRIHDTNAIHHTERLLADVVRVMERIRSWGRAQLAEQGLDADRVVAQSYWELGYWHLTSGNPEKARGPFLASLRARLGLRALVWYLVSHLPPGLTNILRDTKHRLTS